MLIEEVIRTCASRPVAEAAVLSVGGGFADDVRRAASARGMSVGDFTAGAVDKFAHDGREIEMRAVASAMDKSQEPVLAAIERILGMRLLGERLLGMRTAGTPLDDVAPLRRGIVVVQAGRPASDARRERWG